MNVHVYCVVYSDALVLVIESDCTSRQVKDTRIECVGESKKELKSVINKNCMA